MKYSDHTIVIIAGKKADGDALYRKHYPTVFSTACTLFNACYLYRNDKAEQVTLEAFERIFSRPRCFTDELHFVRCTQRTVKNIIIDNYRQRKQETPLDDKSVNVCSPNFAEATHKTVDLKSALAQLPPEQQQVILLKSQGLTFFEIAEIQNIAKQTAASRYYSAARRLRALIESE